MSASVTLSVDVGSGAMVVSHPWFLLSPSFLPSFSLFFLSIFFFFYICHVLVTMDAVQGRSVDE
ncbi:hypothetical protein E2C01_092559 [Portunus trituberculatus]|uniref:Uncharacterized protein n=1 Tax=Portunus trituberculatus TaxID=210409 RepID=A0A5B7JRQ6_PORTR|nr:hypothetical protein [Portunus trituberculatus]